MKPDPRPKLIGPAALAAAALGILLWALPAGPVHDFQDRCGFCHVGLNDPSILTRDMDQLCLSCHPNDAVLSHPSGFFPAKAPPAPFPLFLGKLACGTCHWPHPHYGTGRDAAAMAPPGPFLLRSSEAGKVFCLACHQNGLAGFRTDSHALAIQQAHTHAADSALAKRIDDRSRDCLSCHDGTLSSAADTGSGDLIWEHATAIGVSHPIGVVYEEVYRNNPRTYHPPDRIDPKIIFIDGKIGCQSCHNHYSTIEKKLVVSNVGSRLCLSCHNL